MRLHPAPRLGLVVATAVALWGTVSTSAQLAPPPFGGQQELVADLKSRRARASEAFGSDSVVVLRAAPLRVFADDTNYEYRQESNLLYLTGHNREGITLVLVPGSHGAKEFLFVPESNPQQELWFGRIPTVDDVRAATGVQHVFAARGSDALDAFMRVLLGRQPATSSPQPVLSAAMAAAAAATPSTRSVRLALLDVNVGQPDVPASDSVEATRQAAWIRGLRSPTGATLTFVDAAPRLRTLRQIKTPYEQRVLRRSVEISAEAHIEGMKATKPNRWEFEVEAAIEYWFLKNGAMSWGYPSIVGSGPNATTLHYLESTRRMQAGDLLLVDAAGNFQGLTGDITRTYPVSGRFTADQRALYELVLAAQEAGIAAATVGARASDIDRAIRRTLGPELLELGLVTDPAAAAGDSPQIGFWFPHSAVHGIGVDVHDPLGRLDAGAAFVIEPGLYIRTDTLERMRRDPAQAETAKAIAPAVMRFANLGIRIEDSFIMTARGPDNLSAAAPRSVRDLERVVGTGRD